MPDMEDNKITERESLQIIQQMIQTAKKEQKDNGVSWIIWGWLLFAVSVLTYFNLYFTWFEDRYVFWNYFGILTLLMLCFSVVKYFFSPKTGKADTYTSAIFRKLNVGFFIVIMLVIIAMNRNLPAILGFTIMIGLYGFWMLIYGTLINFKPSVVAAFITWAIAFASLYLSKDLATVMLFHAAAILCGYIIPGHIAYYEFRKINTPAMA